MRNIQKRFSCGVALVAGMVVATPALAQTDSVRVDDLEARAVAVAAELAALRAELA